MSVYHLSPNPLNRQEERKQVWKKKFFCKLLNVEATTTTTTSTTTPILNGVNFVFCVMCVCMCQP